MVDEAEFSPGFLQEYSVLALLGEGAMGRVFHAVQRSGDRDVAVKLLKTDVAEDRVRFLREAEMLRVLQHPNLVRVLGSGFDRDRPFLVLELIRGRDLESCIRDTTVTVADRLKILIQLAQALQYAHDRGVIHRDVKPANAFVERDLHAKLGDFGLARNLAKGNTITEAGHFVGTPAYIAPEQVLFGEVGPAADQYSLAVMAFELMTGRLPFDADQVMECLQMRVEGPAPRLASVKDGLPPRLDSVVARALARHPDDRFRRIREFGRELAHVLLEIDPKAAHPMIDRDLLVIRWRRMAESTRVTISKSALVMGTAALVFMALVAVTALGATLHFFVTRQLGAP